LVIGKDYENIRRDLCRTGICKAKKQNKLQHGAHADCQGDFCFASKLGFGAGFFGGGEAFLENGGKGAAFPTPPSPPASVCTTAGRAPVQPRKQIAARVCATP
jgi:hypothetical protein